MTTINGKDHATNGNGQASKPDPYVLRVFRVEPGATVICRILSESYGGCYTHYLRGRSNLCQGKDCQLRSCEYERLWKGYAAVEVWHPIRKKWQPVCLEITERLELDLRGIFARGQIWEIYREEQVTKKKTPVTAKLLEEKDPDKLPVAFDLVPVLRSLYHVDRIDLSTPNPLPSRIYVTESEGEAPEVVKQMEEREKPSIEQRSLAEEFKRRQKSPTEKKAAGE